MFSEIQFLKENLEAPFRKAAVNGIKEKISSLIDANDSETLTNFFREFQDVFRQNTSVLGIIKGDFQTFVDKLIQLEPSLEAIGQLNYLTSFSWFDQVNESDFKRGYIAEKLSLFSQGSGGLIELQEARNRYRMAQRPEDAARVQRLLSERVKKTRFGSHLKLPEEIPENHPIKKIRAGIEKSLLVWQSENSENRLSLLIYAFSGVRPEPFNPAASKVDDVLLSPFFEDSGIIQTIRISPEDGRVNSGKMASSLERIDHDSYETILGNWLQIFSSSIKEWLLTQKEEAGVYEIVGGTMKHHLNWDDDSIQHFMEGLWAWIGNHPHVALAFWIPFFERALRNKLMELGEDIISPREKPRIEDFVLFDNLLNKASKHYDEKTVGYWRKTFSTKNGLGWNLRNAFCHGLMPIQAMKNDVYPTAVFLAYLLLLSPNEEVIQEES